MHMHVHMRVAYMRMAYMRVLDAAASSTCVALACTCHLEMLCCREPVSVAQVSPRPPPPAWGDETHLLYDVAQRKSLLEVEKVAVAFHPTRWQNPNPRRQRRRWGFQAPLVLSWE